MDDSLCDALALSEGIVCAVGAGGKKSLLGALARAMPARACGLTSTVMTTPPPRALGALSVIEPTADALTRRVLAARRENRRPISYGHPSDKPGRTAGVDPGVIADLHRRGGFDHTLVKADGARMRAIKAPRPGEPVLIGGEGVLVVHVVSVAAIGRPLDESTAHRVERLSAVTGRTPGTPLTADDLATLIAHPEGGRQGVTGQRYVSVINGVDDDALARTAREAAERALGLDPGLDRVVLTSLIAERPVRAVIQRGAGA